MRPLSVVIAQKDTTKADNLASQLNAHFRAVNTATSPDELRRAIQTHRPDVVVVDLELADLDQVEQLHYQHGKTMFICTHRVPDERMWADALEAGAVDVCHDSDVRGIVLATYRHPCTAKVIKMSAKAGAA